MINLIKNNIPHSQDSITLFSIFTWWIEESQKLVLLPILTKKKNKRKLHRSEVNLFKKKFFCFFFSFVSFFLQRVKKSYKYLREINISSWIFKIIYQKKKIMVKKMNLAESGIRNFFFWTESEREKLCIWENTQGLIYEWGASTIKERETKKYVNLYVIFHEWVLYF